jgi:hypothetical protein
MQGVIISIVNHWVSKKPVGGAPVSHYGKNHRYWKALVAVNMLCAQYTKKRDEKLKMVSALVGHPITSTKQLMIAEIYAILAVSGSKNKQVAAEFDAFMRGLMA